MSAGKKFTIMRTSSLRNLAIALSAVALVFVATNSARAALTPIGDPQEGGSWSQRFQEEGVGPFTHIEAIMRSAGDAFDSGFANFTVGTSWIPSGFSSTHIIADGPAVVWLQFDIAFTGATSNPLTFDFYAWNGTTLAERARATWNGSGWAFGTDAEVVTSPVPEPTTMIAGALLLLPFGVSTLRILRKKLVA